MTFKEYKERLERLESKAHFAKCYNCFDENKTCSYVIYSPSMGRRDTYHLCSECYKKWTQGYFNLPVSRDEARRWGGPSGVSF